MSNPSNATNPFNSQGFATGDADNDAWAIRHFTTYSNGTLEFAVAQSFSKNFGLYGERIGALHIVTRNHSSAAKVEAVLKKISRAEITSAPCFGARVVATIIQSRELKEQWHEDLKTMSGRLREMRRRLYEGLTRRNTPGNWGHLLTDVSVSCLLRACIEHDIANRCKKRSACSPC